MILVVGHLAIDICNTCMHHERLIVRVSFAQIQANVCTVCVVYLVL